MCYIIYVNYMFFAELVRHFLWVLLFGGFLSIASKLWSWIDELFVINNIGKWFGTQEFTFLRIFPPAEIKSSMPETANFFSTLCAQYSSKGPNDMYLTGEWHDQYTFEIHSIDGKVGMFVKLNRKDIEFFRNALESRFPGTRIVESIDPFEGLPVEWKGQAGPYDNFLAMDFATIGGKDFVGEGRHDAFPIKTWKEFEDDIDPIHQLISGLESVENGTHAVVQFAMTPIGEDDIDQKIKSKWGETYSEAESKFLESKKDEITGEKTDKKLSETEKGTLKNVDKKISSHIIKTKIRVGVFSSISNIGTVAGQISGYFKQYSGDLVSLYPPKEGRVKVKDSGETFGFFGPWVGIIKNKIYWEIKSKYQKKYMYSALMSRSMDIGAEPQYYSIDEMAGLFHFPITVYKSGKGVGEYTKRISSGYGDESSVDTKALPPSNLPF